MLCVGGGRYGESLVDAVCWWEGDLGVFGGCCVLVGGRFGSLW